MCRCQRSARSVVIRRCTGTPCRILQSSGNRLLILRRREVRHELLPCFASDGDAGTAVRRSLCWTSAWLVRRRLARPVIFPPVNINTSRQCIYATASRKKKNTKTNKKMKEEDEKRTRTTRRVAETTKSVARELIPFAVL